MSKADKMREMQQEINHLKQMLQAYTMKAEGEKNIAYGFTGEATGEANYAWNGTEWVDVKGKPIEGKVNEKND